MKLRSITLLTFWKDNELECCCPIHNKCSKDRGCEELEFTINPYTGIKECMKHDSYKRSNGAIKQK